MFHRPKYYSDDLIKYLSLKPNKLGNNLNKNYFNLAYAAQKVFEEIYNGLIKKTYKISNSKNLVLGSGDINSPIMMVGEAPREKEDNTGHLFQGDIGDLLKKMMMAIQMQQIQVYKKRILYQMQNGRRLPIMEKM